MGARTWADYMSALMPWWLRDGIEPNFTPISGSRAVVESLARRFQTARGTLVGPAGSTDRNEGIDLRTRVNAKIDAAALSRLNSEVANEARRDERVTRATSAVTYDFASETLSVQVQGTGGAGPFQLTLGVTALTTDILDGLARNLDPGPDYGTDVTTFPDGGVPPLPNDGVPYKWGERFYRTLAFALGDLVEAATKGALKCYLVALCPDDAVAYHALDRMIDGVPGESIAALRLRLLAAWTLWQRAGTGGAVQAALALFGATNLPIYSQQITGSPAKADKLVFDPNDQNWSRFWLFAYPPHPWTPLVAEDSLTASDDLVAGVAGMTQVQLAAIRKQVARWRSAHGLASELFVVFDGTMTEADVIAMVADPALLDDARLADLPVGQFAGWGAAQFADDDLRAGYYEPYGNPLS